MRHSVCGHGKPQCRPRALGMAETSKELPNQCSRSSPWDNIALYRPDPDIGFQNGCIHKCFISSVLVTMNLKDPGTLSRGLPGQSWL